METNPSQPGCQFINVMEVIGGKWRGTILYCLAMGPHRFGELRSEIPAISQKMLTQELRSLERDGLVHREQFPEIPPRVEYSLTRLGMSTKGIFEMIDQWHSNLSAVAKSRNEYDLRST